ncbi:hypothetical protein GCM10010994_05780 [Chelatococcus reniformis]|uniref:Uncharacterized protein n=1 Tax=Chelatococcus reniformis TaxID=1494448 RepID=A0A916TXZ8_9HYPH|nr:hypothetical protein GCM10010994_05780 [Chelatococcus reniformis]
MAIVDDTRTGRTVLVSKSRLRVMISPLCPRRPSPPETVRGAPLVPANMVRKMADRPSQNAKARRDTASQVGGRGGKARGRIEFAGLFSVLAWPPVCIWCGDPPVPRRGTSPRTTLMTALHSAFSILFATPIGWSAMAVGALALTSIQAVRV